MELREPCNGGRQTISCRHDAGWPICLCGTEGASLLTDRTTGEGLPIPYKIRTGSGSGCYGGAAPSGRTFVGHRGATTFDGDTRSLRFAFLNHFP